VIVSSFPHRLLLTEDAPWKIRLFKNTIGEIV
jgi:hypothetical protein